MKENRKKNENHDVQVMKKTGKQEDRPFGKKIVYNLDSLFSRKQEF